MSPPTAPRQQHLVSLQAFRALAALWVLLCHVQSIAGLRLGYPVESPFMLAGSEAVSFFFVLSGFIITYVHWQHLGIPGNVRPYLARRLSRIYPLVLILVTLKILFLLVTGGTESKELTWQSAVSSFLLLPSPVYVIDVQWTLVFEVVFYVLFALPVAFGRRFAKVAVVLWVTLILERHFLGYPDDSSILAGTVVHSSCLLFLIGAVSARIFASERWMPRLGWLWVPGLATLVFCIWYMHLLSWVTADQWTAGLLKRLLWGGASAMIILSAVSIERRRGLAWPRWLQILGDASYSIYLVHTSVMMVMVMVLKKSGFRYESWLAVTLTVIGLVSFAVSVLFWRWVERPVTVWWNRKVLPVLSGGRKLEIAGAPKPVPPAGENSTS